MSATVARTPRRYEMIRRSTGGCVVLGLFLWSQIGLAAEVTLAPASILSISHPTSVEDVRLLCRFELPAGLETEEVVAAILNVQTTGSESIPIVVDRFDQVWDAGSSWNSLYASAGSDLIDGAGSGLRAIDPEAIIGANGVETAGGAVVDTGVAVEVTSYVKAWLSGVSTNMGICLRRLPGRSDAMSGVLPANGAAISLVLVYTTE